MKVVIAEKPSVARDISHIIGATKKQNGYLEGNGYCVTWAIGHLVGLSMPKAYGHEKWSLEYLPILPEEFKIQVSEDLGLKKQFNIIKQLFSDASEIIVATDAGREGELIFRYIYELTKPSKDPLIERLWISDLTAESIKEGFKNLKPIKQYDSLYYAGKARSEADWLVGINFTQGYTLASGKHKALSIGRVQTATLRLIVDRYLMNTNFSSIPFFVPSITIEDNLLLTCEEQYSTLEQANTIINNKTNTISPPIFTTDKDHQDHAPVLFDLTTLQRTANKIYKFSAQKTLDIAQALYEKHKATTYPRTDSQYLAENQKPKVESIFKNLPNMVIQGTNTSDLNDSVREGIGQNPIFNNNKISDHHAIIPTGEIKDINHLDNDEQKIYLLIVQRFFMTFLPSCQKTTRKIFTKIDDIVFSVTQTKTLKLGWRILTEKPKNETPLPNIDNGSQREIKDCNVSEKSTKPPAIFNENSLLGAMETAGKLVDDPKLKESLKEKGLGTAATRAGIIETLVKRLYITRDKGKLVPSEIGIELIHSLSDLSISSPDFTGEMEYKLNNIQKGVMSYDSFMSEMRAYVSDLFPKVILSAEKVKGVLTSEEKKNDFNYGKCPKCLTGVIKKGKKSTYCSNWNSDSKCNFSIWLNISKKNITDNQIIEILNKKETRKIKGFVSKAGKKFDAKLIMDKDFNIKFFFDK